VLTGDVDRYIALRRTLGYKLRNPARHLQTFAKLCDLAWRGAHPNRDGPGLGVGGRPDAGGSGRSLPQPRIICALPPC
jgi:hypothetical protein